MPTIDELKSQLKELKKTHKEIRYSGLNKPALQALVDKYSKGGGHTPKAEEAPTKSKAERKAERKERKAKAKSILKSAVSKQVIKQALLKFIEKRKAKKGDTKSQRKAIKAKIYELGQNYAKEGKSYYEYATAVSKLLPEIEALKPGYTSEWIKMDATDQLFYMVMNTKDREKIKIYDKMKDEINAYLKSHEPSIKNWLSIAKSTTEKYKGELSAIAPKVLSDDKKFYSVMKCDFSMNKPYIFTYGDSITYQDRNVVAYGMLMILVGLFGDKQIKTGEYFDVAFIRPPLKQIFKILGHKSDETPDIKKDIFGIDNTQLYFDLAITTDVEEVGDEYRTLLPPKGVEYGGKVDIQMYEKDYERDKEYMDTPEHYLRLTLVDEDDEERIGLPWSSHFRVQWGRADDGTWDAHWEYVVKIIMKKYYNYYIGRYSSYFERLNKPLWDKLSKRFMKYVN